MRKVFVLVIAAMVALMAGCQSEDSEGSSGGGGDSSASSGPAEVGQAVEIEQPGGAKASVTVLTAEWQAAGSGQYAPAPSNGAYLVADVEWSGEGPYNPLYLTFKTEAGQEYDAIGGAMSGYEPLLQSGELAGDKARGFVVFDAPQGAGKITVTDQMTQPAGSWTIPG